MSAETSTRPGGSPGNAAHEERSRQALIHETKGINSAGHDVLDAEGKVATVSAAIAEHEAKSPDQTRVHSRQVMKYTMYIVGIFCVYCLDLMLFGGTAEYLVSLFTGAWFLVLLAKYLTPAVFLGVEVLCALQMTEASKAREEEVPTYGW